MLPKIDYPIYKIKVPSLKKEFQFRPFLVKEEKLLLMAKESASPRDILATIKQVVNNCSLDKKLDIDKLAIFDLEYIFLRLRAISVENNVKVAYRDKEDEQIYEFDVDLEKVEMVYPDKVSNNIKITGKSGLIMRYPPASLYDDEEFLNLEKDQLFELIIRCIESVYLEDNIYVTSDYSKEELEEFLGDLDIKTFEEIQKFLLSAPKMEYVIEYKNSLDHDRKIVLSSLSDFFSWR